MAWSTMRYLNIFQCATTSDILKTVTNNYLN